MLTAAMALTRSKRIYVASDESLETLGAIGDLFLEFGAVTQPGGGKGLYR